MYCDNRDAQRNLSSDSTVKKTKGAYMHKQLLCGVAAVAITAAFGGVALAADVPVRAVKAPAMVAPPPVWAGWYVGGHLGWGQGRWDATPRASDPFVRVKPSGIVGGMHLGQNWENNTFVYGWELDLSATGLNKTTSGFVTTNRHLHVDVDLLASLRGRIGMTFPNPQSLFFLTGGLAYTKASYLAISPFGTRNDGSMNKFGWVAGLGAEWKQTPNLSWRLEGLYYRFDKNRNHGTDHIWTVKFKDALVARIGATYHYSDKRLKRDIAMVARRADGLALYRYRYLWSDQVFVGVMAQEVAIRFPEAITQGPDGYLRVDYDRLGLRLMTWDEWAADTTAKAA
jgi:opacity protein-like surface antigen